MEKKISHYIVGIVIAILIAFGGVQTIRLESTRSELATIRLELDRSTEQSRVITETINNIEDYTTATISAISRAQSTVEGIREQIRVLREYVEEMENRLHQLRSYNSSSNNNLDSKEVESEESLGRSTNE